MFVIFTSTGGQVHGLSRRPRSKLQPAMASLSSGGTVDMSVAVDILNVADFTQFRVLDALGAADFPNAVTAAVTRISAVAVAARRVVGVSTEGARASSEQALLGAVALARAGVTRHDADAVVQAERQRVAALVDAAAQDETTLRRAAEGDVSSMQVSVLFNAVKTLRAAVIAANDLSSSTSFFSDATSAQKLHQIKTSVAGLRAVLGAAPPVPSLPNVR